MPSLVTSILWQIRAAQDAAAPVERDADPADQSTNPDIVRPSAQAGQGVVSTVQKQSTRVH